MWGSGCAVVGRYSQGDGGISQFWTEGGSYWSWSEMSLDSSRELRAERVFADQLEGTGVGRSYNWTVGTPY